MTTAAEVSKMREACRASLAGCVAVIDEKKSSSILLAAIRRELSAVLDVFAAEDALRNPAPKAEAKATAPKASASPKATKNGRSWLLKLLPT